MQLFDPSEYMADTLPVDENEALNTHFEETGYETSDSILGMGSVLIIMVLLAAALLVLVLLWLLCCCQRARQCIARQLQKTLFNRVILFIDSSLLVIATCSWINIF